MKEENAAGATCTPLVLLADQWRRKRDREKERKGKGEIEEKTSATATRRSLRLKSSTLVRQSIRVYETRGTPGKATPGRLSAYSKLRQTKLKH